MSRSVNQLIKKEYPELDETVYEYNHGSGLHLQIIPKPGFYKKFAVCALDFGAVHTKFQLSGSDRITVVPDGVAHFLEHKLFEQPDVNVMDQYLALGASPNAATSFLWTYYYFTCTDNFEKCFQLLMKFVQHPHFTKENVEKEKGIIAQEINMYRDEPEYVVSMNAIDLMYHSNPIKKDIAGTVESIQEITPEILELCHKTFYSPSNMTITVVGDLEPEQIVEMVEKGFAGVKPCNSVPTILFDEEPKSIVAKEKIDTMDVAMPLFTMAFKDDPYLCPHGKPYGENLIHREIAGNIAKSALFGRTSEFYETLYNKGLINSEFYADYDIDRIYAMASIGGESPDPIEVRHYLQEYLARNLEQGIPENNCEMIRKSAAGRMLKRLNAPEALGKMFATSHFAGINPFDYFKAYGKISYSDVMKVFSEIYSGDMVTSIVKGRSV